MLTNVPGQLTSFVGRKADLASVRKLVASSRLVTLVGPGGVGKSRLAIQLSRTTSRRWPDGTFWVDLAPVVDPEQVPEAVAAALKLHGVGGAVDKVIARLSDQEALVILDNCELVVAGCAELCEQVLHDCPALTVLATSREPLGTPQEARFAVSPLSSADGLSLFEQRGRAVVPGFSITSSNEDVVRKICHRLDDLPLAVELVAARLSMLSESEILSEMDEGIGFVAARRSANPRHQTMIAAIGWSYRSLSDVEAMLFRRLAVFRGGFTLESSQAVCSDAALPRVRDTLGSLIEKSMVLAERLDDGSTRYRLLDLQADFATRELLASGEREELQRRHCAYFEEAIETRAGNALTPMPRHAGVAEATWKVRELANLWLAMHWARTNSADYGLELAGVLTRGPAFRIPALLEWIRIALDMPAADRPIVSTRHPGYDLRSFAACAASILAGFVGDRAGAIDLASRAVELSDKDRGEQHAEVLDCLADALMVVGRVDQAEAALDQATEAIDGRSAPRMHARLQFSRGRLLRARGDIDAAKLVLSDALAATEATSPSGQVARVLLTLARTELECSDGTAAERDWRRSLTISRSLGAPLMAIMAIGGLSEMATHRGDHVRAIRLAGAHQRLSEEESGRREPNAGAELCETIARSKSAVGLNRSQQAWNQGYGMGFERATEYALQDADEAEPDRRPTPLTRREFEVVRMIVDGMTNREIAAKLYLSERTVDGHLDRLRNKLGVRSRAEIAVWAANRDLAPANRR